MEAAASRTSCSFLLVYDALPRDAQQLLVRRHLAPLLDTALGERNQAGILATARNLRHCYARMPRLDLAAKKAEVATLLLDIARDSMRPVIRQRCRREQLLVEAVDSIAHWLTDIWQVVFEYRTEFSLAHACLLFAFDTLEQIANACGGCKCSFTGMLVSVILKRTSGKLVKSFTLDGAHTLESVLLWIWRDLFMVILSDGTEHQRDLIPSMIDDIRLILGPRGLELLLYGGVSPCDDDDDGSRDRSMSVCTIDDPDDEASVMHDPVRSPETLYANYWSGHIIYQQPQLRQQILDVLLAVFKVTPTSSLYSSMLIIADDDGALEEEVHPLLMSIAGHSSDNFSAALRILSLESCADKVDQLLHAHKHLLRPKDATSLQFAVAILSTHYLYRAHGMKILEEELVDVANVFRAMVRFNFSNVDSENNKAELTRILAMPPSSTRRARAERWTKGILTPQSETANPITLAGLMMGLPLPPIDDEGDILGAFSLDCDDQATEELREEFRPDVKGRFQGWIETALSVKGGPAALKKFYTKIIGEMPFLRGTDVVEEMCTWIADKPSRAHVHDALEAFGDFCEKQRAKASKRKRT